MGPFAFTLIYSGRLLHDTSPLITYARIYLSASLSLYISIRTNNIPFLSISLLISPFGRSVAKTHQRTHTHATECYGWTSRCALMCRLGRLAYVLARTNNIRLSLCFVLKRTIITLAAAGANERQQGHYHLRTHWPHLAPEINYFRTHIR
jgi:hypothetical protein